METLKLCFVLLLAQTVHSETREIHVKTTGKEPDVFQICTNETQIIGMIACKIRTEMRRGKECRLLYQYGQGFKHECDSRFTLMTKHHTVFLHLTNLTSADSGNYTCQCSYHGGTDTLYLSITVQDDEVSNNSPRPDKYSIVGIKGLLTAVVITVALLVLGCIHRRLRHR